MTRPALGAGPSEKKLLTRELNDKHDRHLGWESCRTRGGVLGSLLLTGRRGGQAG